MKKHEILLNQSNKLTTLFYWGLTTKQPIEWLAKVISINIRVCKAERLLRIMHNANNF